MLNKKIKKIVQEPLFVVSVIKEEIANHTWFTMTIEDKNGKKVAEGNAKRKK